MTCSSCGHENPAAARFCNGCGTTLESLCPGAESRTRPAPVFATAAEGRSKRRRLQSELPIRVRTRRSTSVGKIGDDLPNHGYDGEMATRRAAFIAPLEALRLGRRDRRGSRVDGRAAMAPHRRACPVR